MCVCAHVCMCMWGPEEGDKSLRAQITGSCELPDRGVGNQTRLLCSGGTGITLNHWAISPIFSHIVFFCLIRNTLRFLIFQHLFLWFMNEQCSKYLWTVRGSNIISTVKLILLFIWCIFSYKLLLIKDEWYMPTPILTSTKIFARVNVQWLPNISHSPIPITMTPSCTISLIL